MTLYVCFNSWWIKGHFEHRKKNPKISCILERNYIHAKNNLIPAKKNPFCSLGGLEWVISD